MGRTGKEIAHELGITEAGARKHFEALRRRYAASNTMQLVRRAIEFGDLEEFRRR